MLDVETPLGGIELERQRAVLQGFAVIAAEEGHQQLALEQRVGGVPLDVEELAVGTQAAPFQQVQPPRVIRAAHGHMVGDDIEDQTHVVLTQRGDQATQRRFAPQFRVDAGRVDHIVAVHGAGAGA